MPPYWNKKWGRDQICSITYSRLRPGTSEDGLPYTITLPCGHRYYRKALISWICNKVADQAEPTCPQCRAIIIKLPTTS